MWSRLRDRRFEGLKFVRQYPVGPYFADFACREAMLIVELDGGQHADSLRDERRTKYLNEQGYSVVRFWNNDVLGNTDGVLEALLQTLRNGPSPVMPLTPSLSPEGRGGDAAPSEHHLKD